MRKSALILLLSCLLLVGCGTSTEVPAQITESAGESWSFTDALGREITLQPPSSVVSLYGSFAECWMLAGGTLTGVTEDAITERNLNTDAAVVGTVKQPDPEKIIALLPDLVILSADIAGHTKLDALLTEMQIPHAYFRTDSFGQYLDMLRGFCTLTGQTEHFTRFGTDVQAKIVEAKARADGSCPTVLLLRAYSTGVKAKAADNLAGIILEDLGTVNIADSDASLLEDLSLEAIIRADPDFIFITVMGTDDEAAMASVARQLSDNPAWQELSAVKNGRCTVLPKDLFHYKPNARWGESYAVLADILYPADVGE